MNDTELLRPGEAVPATTTRLIRDAQAERALSEVEHARRHMARLNQSILNSLPINIALLDEAGCIITINDAWRRFADEIGLDDRVYHPGADYLEICLLSARSSDSTALDAVAGVRSVLAGESRDFSIDYPWRTSTEQRWFRLNAYPVEEQSGGAVLMHQDITDRVLALQQVRLAARALRHMAEGAVIMDAEMQVVTVNEAFHALTGYSTGEIVGRSFGHLLAENHPTLLIDGIRQSLLLKRRWENEMQCRRRDGELFPARFRITAIRDPSGTINHYVAVFSDLSTHRAVERRLEYLDSHDSVTGLPRRTELAEHLRLATASATDDAAMFALVVIAVDRFSLINDALGYAAGDELLEAIAVRLRNAIGEREMLARLGSDEFGLVMLGLTHEAIAAKRARQLCDCLRGPFRIAGQDLYVTASAGVTCSSRNGDDFDAMLQKADVAVRQAKLAGTDLVRVYSGSMRTGSLEKLRLQAHLRDALERDELFLNYQPTINLTTGKVASVEALARWRHPILGLVPPARFIPVAEETGLIVGIGTWVLQTACAEAAAWRTAGLPAMRVAINLSARQFQQTDIVAQVETALQTAGLNPDLLRIEVTESMVMTDPERARRVLNDLTSLGLSIAIDDFGTGYSSLSHLQQFPLHCLKVDRSFVKEIPGGLGSETIVRSIITLAKNLGLSVVAEGVETTQQALFVRGAGCEEAQGYLFCRPMTSEAFIEWLRIHGSTGVALPWSGKPPSEFSDL